MTSPRPITGIFGGSFDPPHLGHLHAAVEAMVIGPLDKLIVVPSLCHPWKGNAKSTLQQRVDMLGMLFRVMGSTAEINGTVELEAAFRFGVRPNNPIYTLYVVEMLLARFPDREFRLVIGEDEANRFSEWYGAEKLARLAPPVVVSRPRCEGTFSSTQVRHAAMEGKIGDLTRLVGSEVATYIEKNALYRKNMVEKLDKPHTGMVQGESQVRVAPEGARKGKEST